MIPSLRKEIKNGDPRVFHNSIDQVHEPRNPNLEQSRIPFLNSSQALPSFSQPFPAQTRSWELLRRSPRQIGALLFFRADALSRRPQPEKISSLEHLFQSPSPYPEQTKKETKSALIHLAKQLERGDSTRESARRTSRRSESRLTNEGEQQTKQEQKEMKEELASSCWNSPKSLPQLEISWPPERGQNNAPLLWIERIKQQKRRHHKDANKISKSEQPN